jgi:Kef-type K+ transport system membrane component KefB
MKKLILPVGALLLSALTAHAADAAGFVVAESRFAKMWAGIGLGMLFIAALLPLCIWRKWHALVAELIAGIVLGPTVFGRIWPSAYASIFPSDSVQSALLETFTHIGIFFMLFEIGLKICPSSAMRRGKAALWIGGGGVLIPLILGTIATLGFIWLFDYKINTTPLLYALFSGSVIAVSAIFIIVRMLDQFSQRVTEFGQTVICGYAINDIISWLTFGLIFQAASDKSLTVVGTLLRFVLAMGGTAALLHYAPHSIEKLLRLIKAKYDTKWAVRTVILIAIGLSLITWACGLTLYYGVFLAGILVSESKFMTPETQRRLTDLTQSVMVPIYFVSIGRTADFGSDFYLPLVVFMTIASIGLKFIGAYLSAIPSGRDRSEWRAIAVSFTPSGVNGIIFAGVALDIGLIGNREVVAIVVSTLVSTIIAGPWLRREIERGFPAGKERMSSLVVRYPRLLQRYEAADRAEALRRISPIVAQALTDKGCATQSQTVIHEIEEVALGGYEILEAQTARNIAFLHISRDDIEEPFFLFFYSGRRISWFAEYSIRLTVVYVTPEKYSNIEMRTKKLRNMLATIVQSEVLESDDSSEAHRRQVEEAIEKGIKAADGEIPPPPYHLDET